MSVLVGYICLSPRGRSGFMATILAAAPYPDRLRVPDLRCRASWSPSASPLMVSVCLYPHGVHLPLLSWCTSASPLMVYICLSSHGVRLPIPSWSTSASPLTDGVASGAVWYECEAGLWESLGCTSTFPLQRLGCFGRFGLGAVGGLLGALVTWVNPGRSGVQIFGPLQCFDEP